MRRYVLACGAVIALGAVAACDEKLSDLTGPTPNLQPTLSSIQQEIFNTTDASGRQACANCHTDAGRNPSGGLNLRSGVSFTALVNVRSGAKAGAVHVIPGDPENSYLIHKLEGRAGIVGTRMPRGNTLLTEGQILVIKRWIALGARND
jgi:mono/diheme cytochrome c family protein